MWEWTFLGVSMIVGVELDDAVAALPEARRAASSKFIAYLADSRKPVRAQALQLVIHQIGQALGEMTLR